MKCMKRMMRMMLRKTAAHVGSERRRGIGIDESTPVGLPSSGPKPRPSLRSRFNTGCHLGLVRHVGLMA